MRILKGFGMPPKDVNLMNEVMLALGKIEAKCDMLMSQFASAATKDQLTEVKRDVDGLGALIRENHSNHDSRIRSLENTQSSLKTEQGSQGALIKQWASVAYQLIVAVAIMYLGWKG